MKIHKNHFQQPSNPSPLFDGISFGLFYEFGRQQEVMRSNEMLLIYLTQG